ncbi:hypothetical protein FCIRC_9844 [Fusarium circinatum]|uniref:Uncharacterized protein n=1 Tax=Fusarium circinatum TaxID=48490 RepID=A0A8H5TDH2_FUSCI|nr:hypothetical protein FCIRC_9844 [Fusarium circinatum]
MLNCHVEDLLLSSSSNQMTSSRPQHQEKPAQQEGRLALLPVEVLLNITGEPGKDKQTLSHKDFKSLALSSGVFFRELRQAYYRADNFAAFHSALRCADLEAMERCYNLAKPPTDLTWKVSCRCPSDKDHKHHRPIDDVLECLAISSVPIERCIEGIRWLLSKGYEANEQKDQVWYRNNQHCDHMPELVIDLLGKTSDKARVEGICKIIMMLHDHGYPLPYNMNLHKYFISWYDQRSKPGLIRKPMDVALRSYCPMSFLELLLQEYRGWGANAATVHDVCPPEMRTWVGIWYYILPHWRQSTNFGNVLWGLFLDIADPLTNWKESYQGETADIFEKKIQLLIAYQFVQLEEIQVLQQFVKVLRENPLDFDLIGDDHDGKEYWEKLCSVLGPFMKNGDLVRNDLQLGMNDPLFVVPTPGRLHRFIIEADWNPWTVWHDYKMQDPKHRANLSHPWMKFYRWRLIQRRNGMWYDPEWHQVAEFEDEADTMTGHKRSKHLLPQWSTVNYDDFVAAVEGLWQLTQLSRRS